MNISIPDQHPGRCNNLRHSRYRPGVMLRCIDYEGTPHVCAFEQESPPITTGIYTVTAPAPKPWVRPENICLAVP